MKRCHQGGLIDFANLLRRSLSQTQPIVPVAYRVLQSLELRDKSRGLRGLWRKFRRVASPFYYDPVLMEQFFRYRSGWTHNSRQHLAGCLKSITATRGFESSRCPLQPFADFPDHFSCQQLLELFLMFSTKPEKVVHQLRLATRFLRDLQAA